MKGMQIVSQSRPLSPQEVSQLTAQGCTCGDWSQVRVAEGFRPQHVRHVHFGGRTTLGVFEKVVPACGADRPAGIYNATVHNCTVGDNVLISDVHTLANYAVEEDAIVEDVGLLAVEGESTFGNGVEVAVVNEAGGREVLLCDRLSAHTAYIMAFYRHRPILIEKLTRLIRDHAASVKSSTGRVGKGARVAHCGILRNLKLGPAAIVEGASHLENGSINSLADDPVYIGPGVCAVDFIVSSGARITDGAVIRNCFVGQGTELASQFSATQSLFFANCSFLKGEACSVFAGPHTVSHHKSTLLIAGLFSFFNAGSGTNQSNHLYKLGPVHQGIVERGCKTASDAYIRWPARIGPFTTIVGRHTHNPDLSDLPFSYLIQHGDESLLLPARNLGAVGAARDAWKWPRRDNRPKSGRLDHLHAGVFSPHTVSRMITAHEFLTGLQQNCDPASDHVTHHGVKIAKVSVQQGIALYHAGIDRFLGDCLAQRLEGLDFDSIDALHAILRPDSPLGAGMWTDLAGLLAPESAVQTIVAEVENGRIATVDELNARWEALHAAYDPRQWAWAIDIIQKQLGKTIDSITSQDVAHLIDRWRDASVELGRRTCEDARKEFVSNAQIGFGLDGDDQTRHDDFEAVRGSFQNHDFVAQIQQRIEEVERLAADLLSRLQRLAEHL
jgi:hypothetical protein